MVQAAEVKSPALADVDEWTETSSQGDHQRQPRQVLPQIWRDGDELFEILVKSPRVDLNILDDAGDAPIIWCLKIEETEDLKILLDCPLVKLCSSLLPKTSCL